MGKRASSVSNLGFPTHHKPNRNPSWDQGHICDLQPASFPSFWQRLKQKHCTTVYHGLGGRSPRWDPSKVASCSWHHDLQDLSQDTQERVLCKAVNNSTIRLLELYMWRLYSKIAWPSQLILHTVQPPYFISRLSISILIIITIIVLSIMIYIIITKRDSKLRLLPAVFYRNHWK